MINYINFKIIKNYISYCLWLVYRDSVNFVIDLVFSKLVCLVILVESRKLYEIYEKNIDITSGFTSEV